MVRKTAKKTDSVEASQLCNRLSQLRKKKHWTLEQLSAASDVSRSMLSQIERGQANPTLTVAIRIAQAFGISLDELVQESWGASTIDVIRADDPTHLYRSDHQCRIRTLSPLNMEKDVEFYELQFAPGASLVSAAHFEGTRELLTIEKGMVNVITGRDTCRLKKGDSAHYRADVEHTIENVGKGEARGFLVVMYGA